MIDYRAHLVALEALKKSLAAYAFTDPLLRPRRDQLLSEVDQAPEMAVLGSLVEHLIAHAASDGSEISLVQRAADLWTHALAAYNTIGSCRDDLEAALVAPTDPGSVARFNSAIGRFREFALGAQEKLGDITALRDDVAKLAHIRQHPRQLDRRVSEWGWDNVFLGRRTDAFVRNISARATNPATRALAFGVLSSYSANTCGSEFLSQVVGGPRRAHRFRDRLARNAMGSWFAQLHPETASLRGVAAQIAPGRGEPALPPAIQATLEDALTDTYDPGRTGPLPDLQLGFRRLVQHLNLLDTFVMPPPPSLPAQPYLDELFGEPASPAPEALTPVTVAGGSPTAPGVDGSKPANFSGSNTPNTSDSAPTTADGCGHLLMALVYFLMFLGLAHIYCIGQWIQGLRCELWDAIVDEWQKARQPSQEQMRELALQQPEPLTAGTLPIVAGSEQVTAMVGLLFELQTHLWEGLDKALAFLAVYGLIYPDGKLEQPLYRQFLVMPSMSAGPHRPEPDPVSCFHRFPASPLENPSTTPAYPAGATPEVFVGSATPTEPTTAAQLAISLWQQIIRGQQHSVNFDLDADRRFLHRCWDADGSINDDPVRVRILPYSET